MISRYFFPGVLVVLLCAAVSAAEITSPTVAAPSAAEVLFQAGSNYQNSRQVDKAIAVFEQLLTEWPQEKWAGPALVSLGELYLAKNDETKAEDAWKRAVEKYPDAQFENGVKVGPLGLFQLAYFYESKGKNEEAEKLYRQILDKYPQERAHNLRPFAQIVAFRLRLMSDRKNFSADDLAALDKLFQEATKDPTSKDAVQRLQEIVEKYPKSNLAGAATVMLAQLYAQKGDPQKAEQYLVAAQEKHADSYFPNGAEVAPIAAFYQALLYRSKADQMLARISQQYPDAIDLQGRPLQASIKELIEPTQMLRPAEEGIPVHRPVKKVQQSSTPESPKTK